MKKIFCVLLALALCLSAALAEGVRPVTVAELEGLLPEVRARALSGEVYNDPAQEDARSEDGILFQYSEFALYSEDGQVTETSAVNALLFQDGDEPILRGTGIYSFTDDVLAAYPLENAELAGTREEALLYLREGEDSLTYGRLLRDGQRIIALEYGEVSGGKAPFRQASVTYQLTDGQVSAVRVEGLNPEKSLLDAEGAAELKAELEELGGLRDYRAVKTSRNGLELTPFGEEDLFFSGLNFPETRPENLPGEPDTALIDNEDGTWLLRCDGDGYEAVFTCGAKGENPKILSLTLLSDELEGPRAVRLGDTFSDDFSRFRNGENEMAEDRTELLYGAEDSDAWGLAIYDPDGMSLRYGTTAGGEAYELLLTYEGQTLTEIILYRR